MHSFYHKHALALCLWLLYAPLLPLDAKSAGRSGAKAGTMQIQPQKTLQAKNGAGVTSSTIDPVSTNFQAKVVPDATGIAESATPTNPLILQLAVPFEINELSYQQIAQILYQAENDLKSFQVAGVFLLFRTYTADFTASAQILGLIREFADRQHIPVFAFVDGACQDGGLLISCAASKIYTSSESAIGNIGIGPQLYLNYTERLKVSGEDPLSGLNVEVEEPPIELLSQGTGRTAGNPWVEWQPGDFDWLEELQEAQYDLFVAQLAAARPNLTEPEIRDVLGAKIFLGDRAEQLGLVDVSGSTRSDALAALVAEAGISNYRVIQFFDDAAVKQ